MVPILWIVTSSILLASLIVLIFIVRSRQRARFPRYNRRVQKSELEDVLRYLIREPDHLSGLVEFVRKSRSNPTLLSKGPEVVALFLMRLEEADLHTMRHVDIAEWYQQLTQKPDVVYALKQFVRSSQQNPVRITHGPQVVAEFLKRLEETGLKPLEVTDSVVRFDPHNHHCEYPVETSEQVRVSVAGWLYRGKVLRRAIVSR